MFQSEGYKAVKVNIPVLRNNIRENGLQIHYYRYWAEGNNRTDQTKCTSVVP